MVLGSGPDGAPISQQVWVAQLAVGLSHCAGSLSATAVSVRSCCMTSNCRLIMNCEMGLKKVKVMVRRTELHNEELRHLHFLTGVITENKSGWWSEHVARTRDEKCGNL